MQRPRRRAFNFYRLLSYGEPGAAAGAGAKTQKGLIFANEAFSPIRAHRRLDQMDNLLLTTKMRALSEERAGRGCHRLLKLADALDEACAAPPDQYDAKKVLGCWAQARRAYTEMRGVDLMAD